MADENDVLLDVTGEADPERGADSPQKGGGKQTSEGGGGKKAAAKPNDELASLRTELETERRRRTELEESERYWAGQARNAAAAPIKPKPDRDEELDDDLSDPDPADDTPEKLLDEFSSKGVAALVKRGVLTKTAAKELILKVARQEARKIVENERGNMQRDAQLYREYPDLQNSESELFKETAKVYRARVQRDPTLAKSGEALMMCAEIAQIKLSAQTEKGNLDERKQRARDQMGDTSRGRRGAASFEEEDDDTLSPGQRQIMERLNADGSNLVTEEAYKKFAKRLSMGGMPVTGGR